MKALNCANCGANLNYRVGSPVAICQYCDSVNVIDSVNTPIIKPVNSLSVDSPPNFVNELKPRVMLPREKFRAACYNHGTQGGFLWVADTEIFFKPNFLNFDYSRTYMKIADIVTLKPTSLLFGLPKYLTIIDKNGNRIELQSYSRESLMSAIETRRKNLI